MTSEEVQNFNIENCFKPLFENKYLPHDNSQGNDHEQPDQITQGVWGGVRI